MLEQETAKFGVIYTDQPRPQVVTIRQPNGLRSLPELSTETRPDEVDTIRLTEVQLEPELNWQKLCQIMAKGQITEEVWLAKLPDPAPFKTQTGDRGHAEWTELEKLFKVCQSPAKIRGDIGGILWALKTRLAGNYAYGFLLEAGFFNPVDWLNWASSQAEPNVAKPRSYNSTVGADWELL